MSMQPRPIFRTRSRAHVPFLTQAAIGTGAALFAVAIRMQLPLGPQQLPTLIVVVMLAVVASFVGVWAGIATAVVGGLTTWYLFFTPFTLALDDAALIPLLGFAVISTTIIATASLYRASERRWHEQVLSEADEKADNALLFSREMAHRLKNALAIVQSMAFQTIGKEDPRAKAFAARLQTLSHANELLTEHVSQPTATVRDVVGAALAPFHDGSRLVSRLADATMPDSQVINLALALHELATNATKYGAWSVPGGRVRLTVEEAGDKLQLHWIEEQGPAVHVPGTTGFGSRLLSRAGKDAELSFDPSGFRYSVSLRRSA